MQFERQTKSVSPTTIVALITGAALAIIGLMTDGCPLWVWVVTFCGGMLLGSAWVLVILVIISARRGVPHDNTNPKL